MATMLDAVQSRNAARIEAYNRSYAAGMVAWHNDEAEMPEGMNREDARAWLDGYGCAAASWLDAI